MSPFMGGGSNSSLNTLFVIIAWGIALSSVGSYVAYRFAISTSLQKYADSLPEEFRDPPDFLIWLNVVPVLPCLLNFLIFPMLAYAYRKAFEARSEGETPGLKLLTAAAWVYPFLYPIVFIPYVAPNWMPDKLDSSFEVYVYLGLMFGDILVLIAMMSLFEKFHKRLIGKTPDDASVHPKSKNPLKWISKN